MQLPRLVLVLFAATAAGWSEHAYLAVGQRHGPSTSGARSTALPPQMIMLPSRAALTRLPRTVDAARDVAGQEAHATRILESFLDDFDGEFDNHAQITAEQIAGLSPRAGGGHEHIHCSLQRVSVADAPVLTNHVLATYYFDGDRAKIFRQRLYALDALPRDPQFGACVRMRIYKLRESVANALRAGADAADVGWEAADVASSLHVPDADVFWRWCGERFEGAMRTESIEIVSQFSGRIIRVRDDVVLWKDALWVNDRASDAETGDYVYGNIHDIPYKMQRVEDAHWTVAPPHEHEVEEDAAS